MKRHRYDKYRKNGERVERVREGAQCIDMDVYHRRQFYPSRGADAVSVQHGIWWDISGKEGVALQRFRP